MKYHIITYGCQANISDSERLDRILKEKGYTLTLNKNKADLIVINCCSVRQSAIDRVYGQIEKIKKTNSKIIITGCVLKKDQEKMSKNATFLTLQDFLDNYSCSNNFFDIKPVYGNKFSALVPIMTGCDNFCSYCAVPFTRGREKSRKIKEIIKEIKDLKSQNYKEIWLLGQNVNSYKPCFARLLESVSKIPGDFWIRFTSSHPKDFKKEIIKIISQSNKITEYINLPVQSGDDEILEKMNRPYTVSDYKKCVAEIKERIPNVFLSTDVIVGFPGETKKQFKNTVKLFQEIKYDMAYISRYSARPGTSANNMKDNVTPKEKREREEILNDVLKKNLIKINRKFLNQTMDVLVEKKQKDFLIGKARNYKTIKFKGDANLIGQFIKVKINKTSTWGLQGKII